MIKIGLAVAIVIFSTFCGFLLSKKHRRKKTFYRQMTDFNERFLNEISYYRRPLCEFVEKHVYKAEFSILLNEYVSCLQDGENITGIVEAYRDIDFLTKEEKQEIEDYFQMLGKGDSSSQKAYFATASEWIKTRRVAAEELQKRYGDLYLKLGFLCGLFIVVLII